MDITTFQSSSLELIEGKLQSLSNFPHTSFNRLHEAARYSLFSSGKRLRPLLVMASSKVFGGALKDALVPACAIEFIHTYSLIHDDLPCMDDDDFRRGKPTLHKAFDEATAVLTGDFLLTYAFEILSNAPNLSSEKKIKLISLLAKNSGNQGMIGGQMLDLLSENTQINLDELQTIHKLKTGALLNCSVLFGAILSDVSANTLIELEHFGQCIGLAFQIIDDVLDVTASVEKKGRLVGSDLANHKSTYVSLLGIEGSKQAANQLQKQALTTLNRINAPTDLLKQMASLMITRSI